MFITLILIANDEFLAQVFTVRCFVNIHNTPQATQGYLSDNIRIVRLAQQLSERKHLEWIRTA